MSLVKTPAETTIRSKEPSASIAPPTDSMASAISNDVRLSVPSSSNRLTMIANPAFDSGSYRAPTIMLAFIETVGIEGFSTSNTFRPLQRTWLWTSKDLWRPISVGFIFFALFRTVADEVRHRAVVLTQILTADFGHIVRRDSVDALQI